MPQQTPAQQRKIEKVMHEFKEGDLKTSHGRKVKNPKQAIAIAMAEAGADKPPSQRSHSKQSQASRKAIHTREASKKADKSSPTIVEGNKKQRKG